MEKSTKKSARERMGAEEAREMAGRIMSDRNQVFGLKDMDPDFLKKNKMTEAVARYLETGYPQYVVAASAMDRYPKKDKDGKVMKDKQGNTVYETPDRAFRLEVKNTQDGAPALKLSASDFHKVSYDEGDRIMVDMVFGKDALSDDNAQNHEFIAAFVSALQDAGIKVPGVDVEMNDAVMNDMATLFSKLVTLDGDSLKFKDDAEAYLPVRETKQFRGVEVEYVRNAKVAIEGDALSVKVIRPFDKNKAFIPDSERATPYVGMTDDIVRAIDSDKLVRTAYDPETYCLRMLKDGENPGPGEREILIQRDGVQNTITATPGMLMKQMCPDLKDMLAEDGSLKAGSIKPVKFGKAKVSPEDAVNLLHGMSIKDSTGKMVRVCLDRKIENCRLEVCDANGVLVKQKSAASQAQAINKRNQQKPH